jgi:hypothetical protein
VLGVPSVLVTGAVVVMLVTSVEPPVVMVDSVTKVVESEAEPLSVTDPDPVPELLAVSDVENMVLVERVVVATDPSLFVRVDTISVVEMGITTPPVPVVPLTLLERVVVSTAVVTVEPALSVVVEIMTAVIEAEESPVVASEEPVAETVTLGDVTAEESGEAPRPLTMTPNPLHQSTPYWTVVDLSSGEQIAVEQSRIPYEKLTFLQRQTPSAASAEVPPVQPSSEAFASMLPKQVEPHAGKLAGGASTSAATKPAEMAVRTM